MYFLRAGEMSKISQNAREEMSVFLLPHFERTVSGRKEVFFSRFYIYKSLCPSLPRPWSSIERMPVVKGKAMDMRFSSLE